LCSREFLHTPESYNFSNVFVKHETSINWVSGKQEVYVFTQ